MAQKKASKKRVRNPPETVSARAIKKSIVEQVKVVMEKGGISQSELARRMETSRAVVHRLLKPEDTSITLSTLASALTSLGQVVTLKLSAG